MWPFGVGGELEPHAAGGGLFDEGVAVEAGEKKTEDGETEDRRKEVAWAVAVPEASSRSVWVLFMFSRSW